MGVGGGLNVGNTLQALSFLIGNLPLVRSFELGQHLVEGDRQSADLVLALVIDTVAVILRLAHLPCDAFEPGERTDDMAMGQKGEKDT